MTRATRSLWLAAALAVAAFLPGFAQGRETAAAEGLAPMRVFVGTQDVDAAVRGKLTAIVEFLRLELSASTRLVVVSDRAEADAVATVGLTGSAGSWTLSLGSVRSTDGTAGPTVSATIADLTVTRATDFIRKSAKALDAAYPPQAITVTEIVTERVVENTEVRTIEQGVTLTIVAPAGATLKLEDKETATVDDGGVWSLVVPQNSVYEYRIQLEGFMPQDRTVPIGVTDVRDEPALKPMSRWEVGGDLRYINMVLVPEGLWYPRPGRWYVSAAIESSFMAIVSSFSSDKRPDWFYLDAQVGTGVWLSQPDDAVRIAAEAGLATRLDLGRNLFRFSDYAPASLLLGGRLAWRVWGELSLVLGAHGRLAWVNVPDGTDPLTVLAVMPFGLSLAGGLFHLEAPTVYLGARYGL